MSKKSDKNKKLTVEDYLLSIDVANQMLSHEVNKINKNLDITTTVMSEEITALRNEISRLNDTIYDDRRVLADFVAKFFKDTKTVLNPDLAIDGGKKAKSK
jgi:hypothetical protein